MGQTLSKKRQETTRHDHLQCTFSSNNSHLISSTLYQASSPDNHLFNSTSNHALDALEQILTDIPDDLMIEILSRLPVKSLLRVKSVSKSLLALISSPGFIKTYVRTNNEYMRHRVICRVDYPESGSDLKQFPLKSELYEAVTPATNVDYPRRYNRIRSFEIVGSCNGLVCVTFPDKINGEPGILLWNPSMKKYRKLPKFLNNRIWKLMACGYGYDESNDDYKVVAISSVHNWPMKKETVVKMYSRNTHTWKKIEMFKDGNPMHKRGYFASGRIHWLTSTTMPRCFHNEHHILCDGLVNETDGDLKIVSVNLETKMYEVVEYPEHEKGTCYCALAKVGGCLCVVCGYESRQMDIWIMKEYGVKESWTRVASVMYPEHIVNKIYGRPVFLRHSGEYLLKLENFLVLYNSVDDSIRYPVMGNLGIVRWVDTYVESLVSPYASQPVKRQSNRKRKRRQRNREKQDSRRQKGLKWMLLW